MDQKSGRCRQVFSRLGPGLSGRWAQLTGGRYSEVDIVLKLVWGGQDWSLLTGGHYSEVVVSTSRVGPSLDSSSRLEPNFRLIFLHAMSNFFLGKRAKQLTRTNDGHINDKMTEIKS